MIETLQSIWWLLGLSLIAASLLAPVSASIMHKRDDAFGCQGWLAILPFAIVGSVAGFMSIIWVTVTIGYFLVKFIKFAWYA